MSKQATTSHVSITTNTVGYWYMYIGEIPHLFSSSFQMQEYRIASFPVISLQVLLSDTNKCVHTDI